jgi:hypothetical protein
MGQDSGKDDVTPTKREIHVSLPQNSTRALWEVIFRWFFLGSSDSGSAFGRLPVEVNFHTVSAWDTNFRGHRLCPKRVVKREDKKKQKQKEKEKAKEREKEKEKENKEEKEVSGDVGDDKLKIKPNLCNSFYFPKH